MVDGIVIELFGRISHLWFDVNGVPQLQPLFECIAPCLHRIELFTVLNRSSQLVLDLCLCSAKYVLCDRLSVYIVSSGVSAFPAAVFALANIPFAVGSSFRHRVYLLCLRLAHTITTSTAESQVQSSFTHIFVPHTAPHSGEQNLFLHGREELPNQSFLFYFLYAATVGGRGVCVVQICTDAWAACKTAPVGTTRPTPQSKWLRRCLVSNLAFA